MKVGDFFGNLEPVETRPMLWHPGNSCSQLTTRPADSLAGHDPEHIEYMVAETTTTSQNVVAGRIPGSSSVGEDVGHHHQRQKNQEGHRRPVSSQ